MRIKDMAQTAILICCLMIIPIFASAYFLYSRTDLKYFEILDKSFGVAFGFFGGAATLTAAYIASKLFNNWREQHNKEIINKFSIQTYDSFNNLTNSIMDFGLLIAKIETPEKKFGWIFSQEYKEYSNVIDDLYLKQKKIDDCFYQFLARLREYGIVTNKTPAVNALHQEYIKLFDKIIGLKISNFYELGESVKVFDKKYSAYNDLKNQIMREVIHPLLSNLQAY